METVCPELNKCDEQQNSGCVHDVDFWFLAKGKKSLATIV